MPLPSASPLSMLPSPGMKNDASSETPGFLGAMTGRPAGSGGDHAAYGPGSGRSHEP